MSTKTAVRVRLPFEFPGVHADAFCSISFHRTLRIPDDGREHSLPPSLGCFPISETAAGWALPMHYIEACWLNFELGRYPMAVRVAAGALDALTGVPFTEALQAKPQNYMILPDQPWLDGFKTEDGTVRQFVAVVLGDGLSAEEQLIDAAPKGGMTITVTPMKAARYEVYLESWRHARRERERCRVLGRELDVRYFETGHWDDDLGDFIEQPLFALAGPIDAALGLGGGGRIRQHIYKDTFGVDAWDIAQVQSKEVVLLAAEAWSAVTGLKAPPMPPRAVDYAKRCGLWFDYQAPGPVVPATEPLTKLKSVTEKAGETGIKVPSDPSITIPVPVLPLGPKNE